MRILKGTPKKSDDWSIRPRDDVFVDVIDGKRSIEFSIRSLIDNEACEFLLSMLVHCPGDIRIGLDEHGSVMLFNGDSSIGLIGFVSGLRVSDVVSFEVKKINVSICPATSVMNKRVVSKLMDMADHVDEMSELEYDSVMSEIGGLIYNVKIGMESLERCQI
jgi:hypothetical protein